MNNDVANNDNRLNTQAGEKSRKDQLNNSEANVLLQLEQHRLLLHTVAGCYGALASHSVPTNVHYRLQREHAILQSRHLRLQRKLANSEAKAVELTHLIRQINEDNELLNALLHDTFADVSSLTELLLHRPQEYNTNIDRQLQLTLDDIHADIVHEMKKVHRSDTVTHSLLSAYYQITFQALIGNSLGLLNDCLHTQVVANRGASDLSSALASHQVIAAKLEFIQKEEQARDEQLIKSTNKADGLTVALSTLATKMAEIEGELHKSSLQHAVILQKEKDTIQRLTSTVQKHRILEDALRSEIEQLTAELVEIEPFQEAYYSLSREVDTLIMRSKVAEDEAEHIRKFNAEILGHKNPAQRIMYVDRIRQELAEAKHTIALLLMDQENVAAQNDDLRKELEMYKSVPLDNKPRTIITRVDRPQPPS